MPQNIGTSQGKMPWCRLWSDFPTDPKWRVVSLRSGRPTCEVLAVFTYMLTVATNADPRGTLEGWDSEDVAMALDMETEHVDAIYEAMQGKVLNGDAIANWGKRQPKREDPNATDRKRKQRDTGDQEGGHAMSRNVTGVCDKHNASHDDPFNEPNKANEKVKRKRSKNNEEGNVTQCHGRGEERRRETTPHKGDSEVDKDYPSEFEDCWKAYPKRHRPSNKKAAWRAWSARVRDGHEPGTILAGVKAYHEAMRDESKLGTSYVKDPKTFFGPDEWCLMDWGESGSEPGSNFISDDGYGQMWQRTDDGEWFCLGKNPEGQNAGW